ncbi:MAG: hypothetical protein JW789_02930 [Candidatus Aenigmarchaeota archaeon]|nr:hypothetical protein [Candidatus Aenigmarchaeota archaeon]
MTPAGGTRYVFIEGTCQDSLDYALTVLDMGGYVFSRMHNEGDSAWCIGVEDCITHFDANIIRYFFPEVSFRYP